MDAAKTTSGTRGYLGPNDSNTIYQTVMEAWSPLWSYYHTYIPPTLIVMVSDVMNPPPSLTVHLYMVLLLLGMISKLSSNSDTFVACIIVPLATFTHWMDCTGTVAT